MQKILLPALLSAIALVGGGSNPAKPPVVAAPECTYPDAPQMPAPTWVCDAPVEGVAVSAVGSYEPSQAGPAFTKDQATALGRVRLAQQFSTYVTNMVKQYTETTGVAGAETVDRANASVSKLITSQTLAGSKVFRSTTSPKGSIYVLVGLDPKLAEQNAQQALRTSMNNDRALWQKLQAGRSQDELAAEIARMGAK